MPTLKHPDLVLICADQLRADHLSCYGGHVPTPHLDALAARGVRFADCHVPSPTCTPCRASFLSGCFPAAVRARMVGCVVGDDPRFLPHVLHAAGYHTASIGKIHFAPQSDEAERVALALARDGHYHGLREVDLVNGHGADCHGPGYTPWRDAIRAAQPESCRERRPLPGVPRSHVYPDPAAAHAGNYLVERARAFFARDHATPSTLLLSFHDPHLPFTVPAPWDTHFAPADMPQRLRAEDCSGLTPDQLAALDGRWERDRMIGTPPFPYRTLDDAAWRQAAAIYAGMVAQLDAQVGAVLAALEASGRAERTVVAFIADHGEHLGDHGLCGKGFHFNEVTRVPCLLAGPGVPSGHVVDDPCSLVDLAPSLYELAGIEPPAAIHGGSWLPALRGTGPLPRDACLIETDDDLGALRLRSLISADWRLTVTAGAAYGELYARRDDPRET
nr:sulfatase-like hydrolase/transferase [Planctomycetota bacterium]